jgi:hypothetical protein
MNIKHPLAGALALLICAVPSLAAAQQSGSPWGPPPGPPFGPPPQFAPVASVTPFTVVPPANASVFLYDGRRLLARMDGPGVIWVPTGRAYHIVAMRNDQVLWSGQRVAAGPGVEVRWPAPPGYGTQGFCLWPYPRGPLTAPVELGRERTPNY